MQEPYGTSESLVFGLLIFSFTKKASLYDDG